MLLRFWIVFVLLVPSLASAATLGVPGEGTTLSGVGVISGWKCEATGDLTVRFFADGSPVSVAGIDTFPLLYGSARPDVRDNGACPDSDVGFVAIWNWGNLDDGEYTAVVYDDGVEFARSTFRVVTTGEAFRTDLAGECTLEQFPDPGDTARFVWNTGTQHLEMVSVRTRSVDRSIVKYLTGPVAEGKSPGLIAAIIDEGGVRAIAAAGVRKQGSPEKFTINDLVKMGSITKAMTSTMLATLVEDGTFINGWETTIAEVFPELRDEIHPDYRTVTLWQLVRHVGGVPDHVPAWWVSHPTLPIVERRYRILKENLADPPGSPIGEFSYSNAGYMVAAAMAEKLTGQSWETLMEERQFTPLGMYSAGFGAPNTPDEVDQPWSHRRDSAGRWEPAQLGYDGSLAPAGNVYTSLEDFTKFVALQFTNKRPAILDREQLDELLIPIPGNYGGAAGWVVYQQEGLLWLFTQGGGGPCCGSLTLVRTIPSRGRAYIAAANSYDDDTYDLLEYIVSSLINHSPSR